MLNPRRRNRFVVLASIVSFTVAMSACTGGEDTGQKITLNVVAQAGGPGDALKELANVYSQENPDIAVNVKLLPYETTRERALADFARGEGNFDVVAYDYLWGKEYADGGFLIPLDDYVEANADELDMGDFFPSYIDYAKIDGQLYGLPWLGAVYMLFYNKDLLEQAGVAIPQTWEEYAAAAETLQAETGIAGSTFIGLRDDPLINELLTIAWSYGGAVNDGPTAVLDSPQNLEALQLWARVLESAPADGLAADWPVAASTFAEGQAAMMLNYSDTAESVLDPTSQVADSVGFAAVPAGPTGERTPALGGWAIGINADSENQDAAFEFILWALSAERQRQGLQFGGSVTRPSVLEDPALAEEYPYFPAALENFQAGHAFPKATNWVAWETAMGPALSDALAGQISLEEGLSRAQAELETLVPEGDPSE